MCAHVAFWYIPSHILHTTHTQYIQCRTLIKSINATQDTGREPNYWKLVDSELKKVQDENKDNRAKIHKLVLFMSCSLSLTFIRFFKMILTKDQELYGAIATENLLMDAPDPTTPLGSED